LLSVDWCVIGPAVCGMTVLLFSTMHHVHTWTCDIYHSGIIALFMLWRLLWLRLLGPSAVSSYCTSVSSGCMWHDVCSSSRDVGASMATPALVVINFGPVYVRT